MIDHSLADEIVRLRAENAELRSRFLCPRCARGTGITRKPDASEKPFDYSWHGGGDIEPAPENKSR